MPIPVIVIGGVVVAEVAVVGAMLLGAGTIVGAGYAAYKNWDKIKKTVKGKKVTVLGQRAAGKTTLLNYLLNGEITVNYEQTLMKKKIKKTKTLSLLDLALRVNKLPHIDAKSYDVGGSEDQHGVWKELAKDADVLIYLFDVNKWLSNPKLEPIIERDIKVIKGIINQDKNKRILLIGTHLDQDEGYKVAKDKVAYKDEIKGETFIMGMRTLLGGDGRCTVELASFQDKKGLEEIAMFILTNGFEVV